MVMTNETGFRHLKRIYHAIEQAAFSSFGSVEPYAVLRREKGESRENAIPNRKALNILKGVDAELHYMAGIFVECVREIAQEVRT